MIEKNIRSTSGKILLTIPTELHELTLGHLMALQEKEVLDDLDAISILSGTPKCELQNIKNIADLSEFGEGIFSLSRQIKLLNEHNTLPVKVTFTIDGRKVEVQVINNLAIEPAGAFMAAREIIADEVRQYIAKHGEQNWQGTFQPSLRACCEILAQFFYCRATHKPYDEYDAEAFTTEIKKLGVLEALPLARHFFTCYPNLWQPKQNYLQQLLHRWKLLLASARSRNSTISTRSMPWQVAI